MNRSAADYSPLPNSSSPAPISKAIEENQEVARNFQYFVDQVVNETEKREKRRLEDEGEDKKAEKEKEEEKGRAGQDATKDEGRKKRRIGFYFEIGFTI